MPDYGARVADKAIRRVERELRTTYGTAQRELREKLRDFNAKYVARDRVKRKQLAEGKITRQQYADWKAGQVFQQKQWKSKVREVSDVLATTNQQAINVVNDSRLDVFAENYNFSAFLGEKQLGVSFDVYNTQAVARLIKDDPQILPEWKIDEEKDYEWNAKKVNNIVQQGIIQGEGIPEITKRLCTDLCTQNENRMRMFARTAITGAQNAGRQQQMEDAAEMGIQVEKQWIATLDSRTRDWHRDRDGETVPYNEEFSGGLEYPGDPAGDPADVYNCRCTMITVYPEHAAHHEGGARRAYSEYEDEEGEHRKGYVTENPNVYEGWSEKAYRRWLEQKKAQDEVVKQQPEQKKMEIPQHVLDEISAQTASDDWFEYEYANLMREYIRTGSMPDHDMFQQEISEEMQQRLAAEAELIQKVGSQTKTEYKRLYRGMVLEESDVKAMFKPGQTYVFDTISAATPDKKIAGIYTDVENAGGFGVPVIVEVEKPDGIYGFKRGDLETIIPKGSSFRVERQWKDEDGVIHITLYAKKGKKNVE